MSEENTLDVEIVQKTGRGPGRPKFQPTEAERIQVAKLASLGFSHEIIAQTIRDGIDVDTMKRSFRIDLAHGREMGAERVAETLMMRMTDPDIDCDNIRFKFLKHTAGYTDQTTNQVEHSTKNDEPLQINVNYIKPKLLDANS